MEYEFKLIERNNNGVFPIYYLENIFKELDLHSKLSSLIISYIKKKTQKSYIDFSNFKQLIQKFSEPTENLSDILFDVISFPKDYINKSDLFILIKSVKPDLTSSNL
jgi:hypothetical protein